ncbi:hypothetical protein [Puniceibacterium confluentis]|uniref:hypothetical protein n=1 Tax=Puniceibacterium confluentis TaxID=1958944 RepID=UPI0011B5CE8A|nr:hypothetical protein [Puniceibacterium confluentis]
MSIAMPTSSLVRAEGQVEEDIMLSPAKVFYFRYSKQRDGMRAIVRETEKKVHIRQSGAHAGRVISKHQPGYRSAATLMIPTVEDPGAQGIGFRSLTETVDTTTSGIPCQLSEFARDHPKGPGVPDTPNLPSGPGREPRSAGAELSGSTAERVIPCASAPAQAAARRASGCTNCDQQLFRVYRP